MLGWLFGSSDDETTVTGYGDLTETELSLLDEADEAQEAEQDGHGLRENLTFITDVNGNPVSWRAGHSDTPDRIFTSDGLVYDGREDNPDAYGAAEDDDRPWWRLW